MFAVMQEAQTNETMHRNPTDYTKVTENEVLEDIRYFENRLDEIRGAESVYQRARRNVYRILLRHRRQLLAAIRDGRPEAWTEYSGEVPGIG